MKNEAYFDWLLNRVGVDKGHNGYSCLCEIMYEHQFIPIVEMDDNRWYAARRLRINYADDCGYSIHEQDKVAAEIENEIGDCTFLELLVSLAENMRTETEDGPYDAPASKWFDEMVCNMGLETYTNAMINTYESAYGEADEAIMRVTYRTYRKNGIGGLFPLKKPKLDQREVELAIQLNNYIAENYDIL